MVDRSFLLEIDYVFVFFVLVFRYIFFFSGFVSKGVSVSVSMYDIYGY